MQPRQHVLYVSIPAPTEPPCLLATPQALLGLPKILAENSGYDPQDAIISLQVRCGALWCAALRCAVVR